MLIPMPAAPDCVNGCGRDVHARSNRPRRLDVVQAANLRNLFHIELYTTSKPHILHLSHWLQMGRVDTGGNPAQVVKNFPLGDRSHFALVDEPMSTDTGAIDPLGTVAIAGRRSLPNPAGRCVTTVLFDVFQRRFSGVVTDYVTHWLPFTVAAMCPGFFGNARALAAAAAAKAVGDGIVRVRHSLASLQAWGISHRRGPASRPAFRCPNYTRTCVLFGGLAAGEEN